MITLASGFMENSVMILGAFAAGALLSPLVIWAIGKIAKK